MGNRSSPAGELASPRRVMHAFRCSAWCAHRGAGFRRKTGRQACGAARALATVGLVRAPLLLIGLLLATLALAACGGESKADKAQKQVCDARADISKQVDELKGLTLSTATVSGVRENVNTIQDDLKTIASAQDTLSDDRRAQVKAATDRFVASVTSIAKGLKSDISLSEARTQLTQAAQQLGAAYADSLGKIDCS
jgi:hypothetical protein